VTPKQTQVYLELRDLADQHPTVRSLADRLEQRYHRTERWSDPEVRGLLERLVVAGHVARYKGQRGEVRYQALQNPDTQ
jgi:predicted transcriptional regulator